MASQDIKSPEKILVNVGHDVDIDLCGKPDDIIAKVEKIKKDFSYLSNLQLYPNDSDESGVGCVLGERLETDDELKTRLASFELANKFIAEIDDCLQRNESSFSKQRKSEMEYLKRVFEHRNNVYRIQGLIDDSRKLLK